MSALRLTIIFVVLLSTIQCALLTVPLHSAVIFLPFLQQMCVLLIVHLFQYEFNMSNLVLAGWDGLTFSDIIACSHFLRASVDLLLF